MLRQIKKIFITPFFLLSVLIPALFFDTINIEEIILPSYILSNEIPNYESQYQDLLSTGRTPIEKTVGDKNISTRLSKKVFYDEDSPSEQVTNDSACIELNTIQVNEKEFYSSTEHTSDLYLINCSLLI